MEEVTKQTQAAHRKAVYDFLGEAGVKLTHDQQKELSNLLKSVYETRQRVDVIQRQEPAAPQEYHLTCPKCLGLTVKKGYHGRVFLKAVQKANENAEQEKTA